MPGAPSYRSRRIAAISVAALVASTMLNPVSGNGVAAAVSPPAPDATLTQPDCGPAVTKSTGEAWTCTFVDNFSGNTLDTTKWVPMTTKWTGVISTECRTANAKNISVSGGVLRLTVRKEAKRVTCETPTGSYTTQYTGGNVTTQGRFAQAYGRFEVRASFPSATVRGLHSAIWMWPRYKAYGADSGEIDIAEYRTAHAGYVVPYVHYRSETPDPNRTNNWCRVVRPDYFHTYVLEWTPTTLTVMFDGVTCIVDNWQPASPLIKPQPFDRAFTLILTQSLGIRYNAFDPSVTPLPATMRVGHVRVWK